MTGTTNRRRAMAVAAAAMLVCLGPALAQKPPAPRGYVTTFACGEGDQGLDRLEVKSLGDTPTDLAVRDRFLAALKKAGRTVAAGAPSVLSIETATEVELPKTKGRDLGELRSNNDQTEFRVNVWSTTRDSLIGGRKDGDLPKPDRHFRVSATIHDKATGRCLWQGDAIYAMDDAGPAPLADIMARHLVAAIGQPPGRKPIPAE